MIEWLKQKLTDRQVKKIIKFLEKYIDKVIAIIDRVIKDEKDGGE